MSVHKNVQSHYVAFQQQLFFCVCLNKWKSSGDAVGMRMSDGKKIQKGCPLAAGGTCIKFLYI